MTDLLERLKAALADRYTVDSQIGRGGMATVFLAEDLKHRRRVAIKVLHPELAASIGADRFLHEIEIVAGLSHPHILPLHDSGDIDGLLYYVMPYVPGESLRQRLERETQLAVDEAVTIAVEVADGLDYAHRNGVVHRDVKPGNILLVDGHAVIADFGISRAIDSATHGNTSTGVVVGTPLYASPEQATGQETLDGRTDIYSLGCVLYEMLAGQPPLTGSSPQVIQARRLTEVPSPIHSIRETVPPILDKTIARSLAPIPADRYATAAQLGQALRSALGTTPTPAEALTSAPLTGSIREQEPRRRSPYWLLLAVPIVIGIWYGVQLGVPGDNPNDGGGLSNAEPVQLTRTGGVNSADISPNAEQIAYCEVTKDGGVRLVIAKTEEPNDARSLLVAEYCRRVRWTHDGSAITISGVVLGNLAVFRVPMEGGSVEPLTCPPIFALAPDGKRCAGGWNPSRAVYLLPTKAVSRRGVDSIPLAGEFLWFTGIDWSPVDHQLAFQTEDENGASTLWMINVDGSNQRTVVVEGTRIRSFRWSPDGTAIFYTRPSVGGVDLLRVPVARDRSAVDAPELLLTLDDASALSVSADGRKLILVRAKTRSRLVRIRAVPSNDTTGSLIPISEWGDVLLHSALSHDGRWIAYVQSGEAGSDLFRMPVEGGSAQRITSSGNVKSAAWSPDGRLLAYVAPWRNTLRLWLVFSEGGRPAMLRREIVSHTHAISWMPGYLLFQPPGNRNFQLEYAIRGSLRRRPLVLDEADADDLRSMEYASGLDRMLIHNDSVGWVFSPKPSPNGKRVLLMWNRGNGGSRYGQSWWVVGVEDRTQTRLSAVLPQMPLSTNRPPEGEPVGWTEDSRALYWLDASGVYLRPLDGGEQKFVMSFPDVGERGRLIGCAPRYFVELLEFVCIETENESDVWLVDNFDELVH